MKWAFFFGIIIATFQPMLKYKFITLYIFLFSLTSCFIADDFLVDNKKAGLTLQSKVEFAVKDYIKSKTTGYNYYKYGFSKLIIHKPSELVEIDKLKNELNTKKGNTTELDSIIKVKEAYIKNNKIGYTLEIDHTFSLINKTSKNLELFETKYFLSEKIEVIKTQPLIATKLSHEQEILFEDYFFESYLFVTSDYYESKQLSKEFYAFFKSHQESLTSIKSKTDFLLHTLYVVGEVKAVGEFNYNRILRKLAISTIKKNGTIIDYKSIEFTELFEINENNILTGYYFFHKFSFLKNDETKINAVLIEFSPYYEITKISEVQTPYEKYFK